MLNWQRMVSYTYVFHSASCSRDKNWTKVEAMIDDNARKAEPMSHFLQDKGETNISETFFSKIFLRDNKFVIVDN